MDFSSFGGISMGGGDGGGSKNSNAARGADLKDTTAEGLGFLSIHGESKVRLLPNAWPEDNLPAPTSSLLSVIHRRGLVAAAGPNAIVLANTDTVRKAFEGPKAGDSQARDFQPELSLPMPMRISQLAFTADEEYMVASAETGGGLAVYSVPSLLQGSTQTVFEIGTNGQSLRCLIPNPTAEKGELLALVSNEGKLMMANLKEKSIVPGANGPILKEGVSCLSWSAKGKQLVAGLGDGSATQMTPEGVVKAEIPKPPGMDSTYHMSSIIWLENNVFLVIHTPSNSPDGVVPQSVFHVVTRQDKTMNFEFQTISDPAGNFGMSRCPPHHFILRLREFPPDLQDALIVTSTATTDIGLFTKSRVPVAPNAPAGVFTTTEFADDSLRAAVPSNDSWGITSPIGFALDLSSKTSVHRPIKGDDELEESQTPLPGFMLLNNEGFLVYWWILYHESIKQGTIFSGLAAAPPPVLQASPATQQHSTVINSAPTGSAFGAASGIGPRPSAWGTPVNAPGFGKPAFGSMTAPAQTSSFGSSATPAFGSSTFGTTAAKPPNPFGASSAAPAQKPAFGSTGFATPKSSPWGTPAGGAAFGQASGLGKPSVFGSTTPAAGVVPASGGFASFAKTSSTPFASAIADSAPKESIFGSKAATTSSFESVSTGNSAFGAKPATLSPFGAPASTSGPGLLSAASSGTSNTFGAPSSTNANPFGASSSTVPSTTGLFGSAPKKADEKPSGLFGSGAGFSISSGFKPDKSTNDDSTAPAGKSLFGSGFGSVLDVKKDETVSKVAEMDSIKAITETEPASTTTPASTPAPAAKPSLFEPSATVGGGLFGTQTSTTSAQPVKADAWSFGQPSDTPKAGLFGGAKPPASSNTFAKLSAIPQAPPSSVPQISQTAATPPSKIKPEPKEDDGRVEADIPEAPLPPDTTSKTRYSPGDTSGSSVATDAPLPPDFIPAKPTASFPADQIPPTDVPGGPSEDGDDEDFDTIDEGDDSGEQEGSGDDGSGEDVTKDLSPTSDESKTQSSFRMSPDNTFTKVEKPSLPTQKASKSLFGEINHQAPIFPPPNHQTSPRSPSPIRNTLPRRLTRPDAARSVSAPGIASQILGGQRAVASPAATASFGHSGRQSKSTYSLTLEEKQAEERRKAEAKARKEAEEAQALEDEEDQKIQEFINSDLEPTTTLDEFQAHIGNVGDAEKSKNVPAQVEAVYKDINSMIDTLGLNARALKCFVLGHEELSKDEREKKDLEDEEDWCLVEVEALSSIVEYDLTRELEQGFVKDVAGKLDTCSDLQKELRLLNARVEDIKKIISSHTNSDQAAITRQQPLSAEQSAQQKNLRKDFTKFQKLLAEAEESLSILKSKIVSQLSSSGRSSGTTVEAVMKTIMKMTSMAEKRSGDIDVLEGQMRKLRFGSLANGSREGSPQPLSTPQSRSLMLAPGSSSYGLFYTPDSSIRDDRQGLRNSFMSSTNSPARGSPGPRKKLSGYTGEEKAALRANLAKKKDIKKRLQEALEKVGTTARLMDDE